MKKLLRDLSYLSELRDRQAMDFALVKLIGQSDLWCLSAVRLLRAVGPESDQHWVTLGELDRQHSAPQRDQFWFDVSTLPRLSDFAQREAVIVTESVVRSGHGPFTTIFPIDTQASVCSLLEVESDERVSVDTEALIDSVLHLYENLQGLLDYGERDPLTELLNRKTFDGAFLRAAQTQDAAATLGHPDRRNALTAASYWLAVIDIDHFKHVNDNFGHLIGDEVLLLLARQMRNNFRFHDQLYRFGGEEFVVLMRCTDHQDALAALERFRCQIAQHAFPQVGHITISIGVAPLRDNDTPSGAFDRADKAVYYANSHGRNQTCSFTLLVEAGELAETSDGAQEVDFF
ncbi:MAG: GGDEF domain-containing protein [Rhodoferax sp.]|jgi:diguanylate cyclase (GGDEF)-like protein|nr:GGDEF domain-containing protein [Rhodoferax sp.]